MKKGFRMHLQKFCDVSNWTRMHNPSAGKKNAEAAEKLAEDIHHANGACYGEFVCEEGGILQQCLRGRY